MNLGAKLTGDLGAQYIGLSVESGALSSGRITSTSDLVHLLRDLGGSVLRFGGGSSDTSFTGISPSELHDLAELTKASGWSALYTENMGKYNPGRVTADAREVSSTLGDKLFGFACGNEPDVYPHNGLRQHGYSAASYVDQATACLQAIRAAAPHAALEGPDTAGNRNWFRTYAEQEGDVSWLGQHYYPMGCATPGDRPTALVAAMLSPNLAAAEAKALGWYTTIAKTVGKPLLITETNSACGGGIHGLSDAYASALWAIDYMLTGAEHDVAGMYFHTGSLNSHCDGYTVICQSGSKSFTAQPIYYGLLFAHLLGTGKFLPSKVSMPPKGSGNVAVFALRPTSGGLRLMLENLSQNQLDATLHVGDNLGAATVFNLTGPSPLATSGVQIQGASVAVNGDFHPGFPNILHCSARSCSVTMAPYSAALISFG